MATIPRTTEIKMQDAQSDAQDPPLDQAKQYLVSTLDIVEHFAQQDTEAQRRICEQEEEIESLKENLAAERLQHARWREQSLKQSLQINTLRKERGQLLNSNRDVLEIAEKLADLGPNAGLVDLTTGMEELQKAVRTRDEGGEGEEHGKAVKEARKKNRGGLKMRMSSGAGAVVQGGQVSAGEGRLRGGSAGAGSQGSSARPKLLLKRRGT